MYLFFIVHRQILVLVCHAIKPNCYMFKCILALAGNVSKVFSRSKAWDQIPSEKGLTF